MPLREQLQEAASRPVATPPVGFTERFAFELRLPGGFLEPAVVRGQVLDDVRQQAENALGERIPQTGAVDVLEFARRAQRKSPELNIPTTNDDINRLSRERLEALREERRELSARSTAGGVLGGITGMIADEFTNPFVLATLAAGAGTATSAVSLILAEAGLALAAEVPTQMARQAALERAGLEDDVSAAMQIALATVGGGVFGGTFALAARMFGRLAQARARRAQIKDAQRRARVEAFFNSPEGRAHVRQFAELSHADARFPFAVRSGRTQGEFLRREALATETAAVRGTQIRLDDGTAPVSAGNFPDINAALRASRDVDEQLGELTKATQRLLRNAFSRDTRARREELEGELALDALQSPAGRELARFRTLARELDNREELERIRDRLFRAQRADLEARQLKDPVDRQRLLETSRFEVQDAASTLVRRFAESNPRFVRSIEGRGELARIRLTPEGRKVFRSFVAADLLEELREAVDVGLRAQSRRISADTGEARVLAPDEDVSDSEIQNMITAREAQLEQASPELARAQQEDNQRIAATVRAAKGCAGVS